MSDASGNPLVKGYTSTGRWLVCIYEPIDGVSILPVTAYEPADESSESSMNPTPSQIEELKQRWRRAVKSADAEKPAIVSRDKKPWAALEEQTLSGELRRAIFESPLNTGEIAARANVPLADFNSFLHGETSLDSQAFNRIAQVRDCHLISSP